MSDLRIEDLDPKTQEKLKLLLKERKAREDSLQGLKGYIPLPPIERFHRAKEKFRLLIGGNRSSKTLGGCVEDAWHFCGNHPWQKTPKRPKMEVVSLSYDSIGKIIYPKLFEEGAYYWYEATCEGCGEDLPKYPTPIPASILGFDSLGSLFLCSCGKRYNVSDLYDYRVAAPPLIPPKYIKDISWEQKARNQVKFCRSITGAEIWFMGGAQGRAQFQGISPDFVHIDEELGPEATGVASEIYRGLSQGGRFWWTATPLAKQMPLINLHEKQKEQQREGKKVTIFIEYPSFLDNYHCPVDEREESAEQFDRDELKTRLTGEFLIFSGKVYKDFNTKKHIIDHFDIPSDWPIIMAMDVGLNNFNASLWVAITPDNGMVVFKEDYVKGKSIDEITQRVQEIERDLRITPIVRYIDPSDQKSIVDNKGIKTEFALRGLMFQNGRREGQKGRQLCKQRLRLNEKGGTNFGVFMECRNFIREVSYYRWGDSTEKRDAPESPLKKDDHLMDAWKYIENSRPNYNRLIDLQPEEEAGSYAFDQFTQMQDQDNIQIMR